MNYRKYKPETDKDAVYRILNEVGWVHDKKKDKYLNDFLAKGDTLVALINNEAEVMVVSSQGTIRYLETDLKLSAITGVTASLLARKQGYAGKLTATRIAIDAENGAEMCALGIFDQGYYNKLGFCNGTYEIVASIIPASLDIKRKVKQPNRLTEKDWEKMHENRIIRNRVHGSVTLPSYSTYADIGEENKNIGFGYYDDNGNLTHHLWFQGLGKENGPIWIKWMIYQNLDQLMDLLALLKSFEEQYHCIRMIEPPQIQIQDYIKRPHLYRSITLKSQFNNETRATSFWQIRILNLEKCLSKTHLNCDKFSFNLKLNDPIEKYISEDQSWKGISGEYIITLGNDCKAVKGKDKSLLCMEASVGAFTRMWYGIMPATSLVFSDGLIAENELLNKLDTIFRISKPHTDWEF